MMRSREIADIAFGHQNTGILVVIRAYFDGSGKEENPVLTVGGFVADCDTCERIESDWKGALDGKGGPFHLSDFGTSSCKLGSGSWPPQQQTDFLIRLAAIVNRTDFGFLKIVSVSVETSVYNSFHARSKYPEVHGAAYSQCAQLCFARVENLLLQRGMPLECVAYVFEKGEREHEIHKSFGEYENFENPHLTNLAKKRSLHFLPKYTTLLQPTDLIAGTVRKVFLRAQQRLGSLDNGRNITPIEEFSVDYSHDGVSKALFTEESSINHVANARFLKLTDENIADAFSRNPAVLAEREKQRRNQGKRK